jgi:hypothetical protein
MEQTLVHFLLAPRTARAGFALLQQHHFLSCLIQQDLDNLHLSLWDQINAQKRVLMERSPVDMR